MKEQGQNTPDLTNEEEKSEEEIEIIEGQEEGNKSNKSGSEDEVSNSLTENKLVSMYDC